MIIYDAHLHVSMSKIQDQIPLNIMVITMEVPIFTNSHHNFAETLKWKDECQKLSSTDQALLTINVFLMVLGSTGKGACPFMGSSLPKVSRNVVDKTGCLYINILCSICYCLCNSKSSSWQ
jgi:hypothetical protein